MHAHSLSLAQIMFKHKQEVRDMAMCNQPMTCDIFLLLSNVRNICCKQVEELWEKHASDPISVCMWVHENLVSTFVFIKSMVFGI